MVFLRGHGSGRVRTHGARVAERRNIRPRRGRPRASADATNSRGNHQHAPQSERPRLSRGSAARAGRRPRKRASASMSGPSRGGATGWWANSRTPGTTSRCRRGRSICFPARQSRMLSSSVTGWRSGVYIPFPVRRSSARATFGFRSPRPMRWSIVRCRCSAKRCRYSTGLPYKGSWNRRHCGAVEVTQMALTKEAIEAALERGHTIDITTTGRRSGKPRRLEIVFHNIGGRIYINRTPYPKKRRWLLHPEAEPPLPLYPKGKTSADLPATARVIDDEAERREILPHIARAWRRDDVDRMVRYSPLIEVTFE